MYTEPIKYIFHGKLQNGNAGNCHKIVLLLNLHSLFPAKMIKNRITRTKSGWRGNGIFDAHIKKEVLHIVHFLYFKLIFTSFASVVNDMFSRYCNLTKNYFWFCKVDFLE